MHENAKQIANARKKMNEEFEKFLNDPEAQAERAAEVAASITGKAFKHRDYHKFIELLDPHHKYLSSKQKRRMDFAKAHLLEK